MVVYIMYEQLKFYCKVNQKVDRTEFIVLLKPAVTLFVWFTNLIKNIENKLKVF